MSVVRRVAVGLVLASVLLTGAVGSAVASDDAGVPTDYASDGRPSVPDEDSSEINVTQEFQLTPSTAGEVMVQLRFDVPRQVISLRTTVPKGADVIDTEGFDRASGRKYDWNGESGHPTLTYTLPVNESLNETGPEGTAGGLVAVDAGEWALFQRPPAPVRWENYATGEPLVFNRTTTTDGPGAAGEWLVYLGEHETYERTAHDQQFRLVVPSNANVTAGPETVLDSLADASNALRVGDRDEEVFVVAAPTDDVQFGVRGLQTGGADIWVRDAEPVASPENAWVHEYVHSRQAFTLGPEMGWFREAAASYYAALLTYEQNHIPYERFSDRIARGANRSYADAVLANRSTWQRNPDYDKGALVAGQLDRQIRNARAQERTLQTVVRAMNGESGPTFLSTFLEHLTEHGGERIAEAGARYARTTANVSMWNRTAHVTAFSDPPARIGFQLPSDANAGTYRVNSSYRNATVGGDGPIVVVPGERLHVGAVVENAGGTTGNYTTSLAVNGTTVDRTSGTVEPNETVTAALTHRFTSPGTYELALEGNNRTVEVREPAAGRVIAGTASPRVVWRGEAVELSARVENDAPLPGEATVVFRRDDGFTLTKTVDVGPESVERVNVTMPMSRVGTTAVSVDGAGEVWIAVRAPPARTALANASETGTPDRSTSRTTSSTPQSATANSTEQAFSDASGPGFGRWTVALGMALAVALALARERY